MTESEADLASDDTVSGSVSTGGYKLSVYDITHTSPVDDTEIFIHFLNYLYSDCLPPPQVGYEQICNYCGYNSPVSL